MSSWVIFKGRSPARSPRSPHDLAGGLGSWLPVSDDLVRQSHKQFGRITEGRCLQPGFRAETGFGRIIRDTELLFLPREIGRDVVVKVFHIEHRVVRVA